MEKQKDENDGRLRDIGDCSDTDGSCIIQTKGSGKKNAANEESVVMWN